ncbi:MAG: hypothetical protein HKN42_08465 [Granulosicoccus sp.]|nr:hypothetical protein [Granulosicoccus sp.]
MSAAHIILQSAFARPGPAVYRLLSRSLRMVVLLAGGHCLLANAWALEYQCELYDDTRHIAVEIPGEERLCEVSVTYNSTGERKVMWYAENDSLFCTNRAMELVQKYEKTWDFRCLQWPYRDGIEQLSTAQRAILNQQLKLLMAQGERADETFRVAALKATVSTPQLELPSVLALQFFLSDGTDRTQIIVDEGRSWKVLTTIENLASQVTGSQNTDFALVSAITDAGALELTTTVINGTGHECQGRQVLMAGSGAQLQALSAHKVLCQPG